jgi:hypothetical protein
MQPIAGGANGDAGVGTEHLRVRTAQLVDPRAQGLLTPA